jgi:tRNA-splicing ligase RtcB
MPKDNAEPPDAGEEKTAEAPPFEKVPLQRVSDVIWQIPLSYKTGMRVPARLFATESLLKGMDAGVFEQVTNVACMPGIVKHVLCMPDAHWGYGFPIGGVAAFDIDTGVISPGAIGFDVNCGMRLLVTNLTMDDVRPKLKELVDMLFKTVPAGVGSTGFVKLDRGQFSEVVQEGAAWCVRNGYGWDEDVQRIEENGRIPGADPDKISQKAVSRGINQLGTLGSGNHYLEIQYADTIHDKAVARKFGITKPGQVCIMVHCGSRGFGHQVATDALKVFSAAMPKYGISVRDPELACAPFSSKEGQDYYAGMACAANMAFANRQVILHRIREAFSSVFRQSAEDLGMHLVYDVAHNIAKVEEHIVDGKKRRLVVHRKGATRSFGPGRKEVPAFYRDVGQPVIVGGSMETGSYLLVGTDAAMKETWGSTCHGSGRTMSRHKAKHAVRGEQLQKDMAARGIYVRTASYSGLAEEAGFAYKSISEVVETCAKAGISLPVVQLRPMGNVKG